MKFNFFKNSLEDPFFESSKNFNLVCDINLRIKKSNDAWHNLGYNKRYLTNRKLEEIIFFPDKYLLENIRKDLLLDPETREYKLRFCKLDSSENVSFQVEFTKHKNFVYIICNNITELEENKLLIELSKDFGIGVWDWNSTTGLLKWSPKTKEIFGLPEQLEPNYDSYIKSIPESEKFNIQKIVQEAFQNKSDYQVKHTTNTGRHVTGIGKYKKTNGQEHLLGLIQDTTEEYLLHQRLSKEKHIAEVYSQRKSEFVANISHEIRTPLNGIVGVVNLLKNTDLNEEQKEYVNIIEQSSGMLLSIVNNVLDLSKIESGVFELSYKDVKIKDIVDSIYTMFKQSAIDKDISFSIKIQDQFPEYINTDPVKFNQILANLISNAIKFTEYGSVNVIISRKNESSDDIVIHVKDTGVGISEENQRGILDPYFQVQNVTKRKHKGTGLGLTICKSIITNMKGELKISSKEHVGSVFIVTLPAKLNNFTETRINTDKDLIVLVEDNSINNKVMCEFLKKLNIHNQVFIFDNGEKAYNNIINFQVQPKLIFMDLHMPRMNGFEATKALRKKGIKSPIVAVTANSLIFNDDYKEKYGFSDALLKPIKLEDIELVLKKYIV